MCGFIFIEPHTRYRTVKAYFVRVSYVLNQSCSMPNPCGFRLSSLLGSLGLGPSKGLPERRRGSISPQGTSLLLVHVLVRVAALQKLSRLSQASRQKGKMPFTQHRDFNFSPARAQLGAMHGARAWAL